MQRSRPSLTAHRVAMQRAAHQLFDDPLVFHDVLAVRLIGAEALVTLRKEQPAAGDPESRSLRAFMSVRSRYAEDQLATAVARGVRQYVVLGAGLDTFAYRNVHTAAGLRVFEVDHPATQSWKRELLAAAGIGVPSTMTFVPVDFEQDQLAERLRSAGFDFAQLAFFCWLGVVIYLTPEAFLSTLQFVRAMPPRSGIALDYAVARSALTAVERDKLEGLTKRVGAVGEPFRLFFEPQQLAAQLTQMGFTQIEDLGHSDINARYFANRTDGLQVTNGIGRLLSGWVPGP